MALMKTEFTEVSETRKQIAFEVPPDVVEAEIARVAQDYTRSARVPGFRPGKVPARVVRQRYKDQILHDVAHDLIPRLVGTALHERGLKPVAAPDIKDVVLEEGQPLTFAADFETVPPIDPGEYTGIALRKPPAVLEVGAVDAALAELQERHARWQPIEDRPAEAGDTLLLDLTRTRRARLIALAGETPGGEEADRDGEPERLENVSIEIGASANPPGFDDHLIGTAADDARSFTVNYPNDYEIEELRGATVDYEVTVKGIRRKELLAIDDDFAKEVSDVGTIEALRARVHEDLQRGAEQEADHQVRHDLLQHLSSRIATAPEVLVEQEVDRRLEDFVRRLMEQGLDPMQVNVDWKDFRERQRVAATETVKSTLVLDEIGRRESLAATEEDLAAEIARFADRAGHTPAAVRARLEKEGAIGGLLAGIRREKTMTWLLEKAQVSS
jgi:trigger factor